MLKTFWNGQHGAQFFGILLTAVLSVLASFQSHQGPWLERLELVYYDWRFNAVPLHRQQSESDINIVIVDIDEASLATIGQWPWRRQVLANLVNRLAEHGAIVVGFDVVFAEYEQAPLELLSNQIKVSSTELSKAISAAGLSSDAMLAGLDGERQLAAAMSNTDVVLEFSSSQIRRCNPAACLSPQRYCLLLCPFPTLPCLAILRPSLN